MAGRSARQHRRDRLQGAAEGQARPRRLKNRKPSRPFLAGGARKFPGRGPVSRVFASARAAAPRDSASDCPPCWRCAAGACDARPADLQANVRSAVPPAGRTGRAPGDQRAGARGAHRRIAGVGRRRTRGRRVARAHRGGASPGRRVRGRGADLHPWRQGDEDDHRRAGRRGHAGRAGRAVPPRPRRAPAAPRAGRGGGVARPREAADPGHHAAGRRAASRTRDPNLSAPALFLAGSVARAGRTEHPAQAAAIERLVLVASARARGTDEQLEALAALGNLGSATVLPRLRQAVTAGDPRVRAAATRALRLVPDREADRLLAVTLRRDRRSDRAGGGDLRRGLPTARAAGRRPRRHRPERSDRLRPCRRRHLAGAEP